jgi:hypothetical protein
VTAVGDPVDTPYPLGQRSLPYTLKATLHGYEVMVTLRGVDFASVRAQVEQASEWLNVQLQPGHPPSYPPRAQRSVHTTIAPTVTHTKPC